MKPETTTSKASLETTISPKKLSEEFWAGLLVSASLAGLLFLLFVSGNVKLFAGSYDVPVLFNYISGLEVNSPVHFGGHEVGKVKKISLFSSPIKDFGEDTTNTASKILVTLSVSKDVTLRQNSEVFIDVLGFMGEKFVELSPGAAGSPALEPGQRLQGTDPVPLMKIVKDGTELLGEFEKISDSLSNLVGNLDGVVNRNQTNLDEIIVNLNDSSKNLKEMTDDLKKHPWKLLRKSSEKKKRFLIF